MSKFQVCEGGGGQFQVGYSNLLAIFGQISCNNILPIVLDSKVLVKATMDNVHQYEYFTVRCGP